MKLLKIALVVSISAGSTFALADNRTKDAVIGGGLGGALGGYIGSETGGRTGGILGSAAGAALGSAIMTSPDSRDVNRRVYPERHSYQDRYIEYRPTYKQHKKCPPGLAKQGRC